MFRNFLFLGFGLIGGSIARGIRAARPDVHISAWARRREKLEPALADHTLDEIADSLTSNVGKADVIFLCAPTGSNIENLRTIAPLLGDETLVTDVGSVKGDIQKCAEELGIASRFLGGHPMTGKETTGYESADTRILENAYYILAPSEQTEKRYVEEMTALVESLRSIPLTAEPSYHDYAAAAVSHVPHLIAAELVRLVKTSDNEEEFMRTIAAGGFKDITRIASSDPAMWESICRSNTDNIRCLLERYRDGLSAICDTLEEGDFGKISELFRDSGAYRSNIYDRRGSIRRDFRLFVDIPDEAGQIAAVATELARAGINIKNIGITHNREQAEGALYVVFYDEAGRSAAIPVLENSNFRVIL
ncbi:MAG: prephenate dehydrogenase [Lachnospiraceae bacterium]|nr:prephenate dehydrogenase [Lachnospiraceae bacterium]